MQRRDMAIATMVVPGRAAKLNREAGLWEVTEGSTRLSQSVPGHRNREAEWGHLCLRLRDVSEHAQLCTRTWGGEPHGESSQIMAPSPPQARGQCRESSQKQHAVLKQDRMLDSSGHHGPHLASPGSNVSEVV